VRPLALPDGEPFGHTKAWPQEGMVAPVTIIVRAIAAGPANEMGHQAERRIGAQRHDEVGEQPALFGAPLAVSIAR
jgi:hypothetical protein